MKKTIILFSIILLVNGCSFQQSNEPTAYQNETYGFQLTLPASWEPITEIEEGGKDGALAEVTLLGGEDVIQIGTVPLYLRSVEIGVYAIEDKEEQLENEWGLYNNYMGENENYAFFYEAAMIYMYPYGCDTTNSTEEEVLCEEYRPAYEETLEAVTTFVALP